MPRKIEEITIIYAGERWRRDDFAIANAHVRDGSDTDEPIGIKGESKTGEMQPHFTYRLYGHWDKVYEGRRTFAFKTFVEGQPHGRAGVVRYLQNAPGVGLAIANKLWEKFRSDAVRILREEPEIASAAVGGQFSDGKASKAAEWLIEHKALEDCTISLIELLGGEGFPKTVAKKIVGDYGNRAAEIVQHNPYILQRYRGVGFLRCDNLYLKLGKDPARLKRQAYCAAYAVKANSDGHTWLPIGEIERGISAKVSGTEINAPAALLLAKRGKLLDTRRDERGQLWIADWTKSRAEQYVANHLTEAMASHDVTFWSQDLIEQDEILSVHQKEKLLIAMGGIIGILGGSPGVGKSFCAAAVIRWIIRKFGESVAAAAPTGKAAVRLTEFLVANRLPIQAVTIHRLLGVESHDSGAGWSFKHNELNPLPFRFLFVDESSMIDSGLMASLLAARAAGTHVLFVGDINQLPPVGHGAPLRDMIAAGLPYGELTEIHRNAGTIVRSCASIRDGKPFATDSKIDIEAGNNLAVVNAATPPEQIGKMLAAIQSAKAAGFDPVWDVQVVVPVNKKSPLARKTLNQLLQKELNPGGQSIAGSPFRVGDKVVNLKNGFFPCANSLGSLGDEIQKNDKDEIFVANGELGEVVAVSEKLTTVRLSAPERLIKVPRGTDGDDANGGESSDDDKSGTGCNWDLGFALSVHKSQGSSWPVVIIMLDEYPGARRICDRSWLYTAISRAEKLSLLIGKESTAHAFCRRVNIHKRKTFLVERIAESRALLGTRIVESSDKRDTAADPLAAIWPDLNGLESIAQGTEANYAGHV